MKLVVAMDSFKGSVSSQQAGQAVKRGALAACPQAEVRVHVIADGGEGLLSALAAAGPHKWDQTAAIDATGQPVTSQYLQLQDGTVAIESASTIGLAQLTTRGLVGDQLPPRASSIGLGIQVSAALAAGARKIVIGLGGTASTDGGLGFLLQLGAKTWDGSGHEILPIPGDNPLLRGPQRIELPQLPGIEIIGLVDVKNPLLGPLGAAQLFGPQKGANQQQVTQLETAMEQFALALETAQHAANRVTGVIEPPSPTKTGNQSGGTASFANQPAQGFSGTEFDGNEAGLTTHPGAGAAGGLGAAILALGGKLTDGFGYVANAVGLKDSLSNADLVITGEGCFDAQSALGKVPIGVALLARQAGARKIVALAGKIQLATDQALTPLDAAFCIHDQPMSLSLAMQPEVTLAGLERTAYNIVSLLH